MRRRSAVMRVVAGSARGRRLRAPAGDAVRPTGDRVREATFNSLGSLGLVHDAEVVDLFAGSGALGIEALSRGAAHATFVDDSSRSLDVVRANLDACGFTERATVVRSDALEWVRRPGAEPADVALVDPPYRFDRWSELLGALVARTVVIESDREIDPGARFELIRQRRYGGTVVTIAEQVDRDGHGPTTWEDRS